MIGENVWLLCGLVFLSVLLLLAFVFIGVLLNLLVTALLKSNPPSQIHNEYHQYYGMGLELEDPNEPFPTDQTSEH